MRKHLARICCSQTLKKLSQLYSLAPGTKGVVSNQAMQVDLLELNPLIPLTTGIDYFATLIGVLENGLDMVRKGQKRVHKGV